MVVTHVTRNMTEIGDIQYINSQSVLWSILVPLHKYRNIPLTFEADGHLSHTNTDFSRFYSPHLSF